MFLGRYFRPQGSSAMSRIINIFASIFSVLPRLMVYVLNKLTKQNKSHCLDWLLTDWTSMIIKPSLVFDLRPISKQFMALINATCLHFSFKKKGSSWDNPVSTGPIYIANASQTFPDSDLLVYYVVNNCFTLSCWSSREWKWIESYSYEKKVLIIFYGSTESQLLLTLKGHPHVDFP